MRWLEGTRKRFRDHLAEVAMMKCLVRLVSIVVLASSAMTAQAEVIYAHRFSQGDLLRFDTNTATETVIGNTGLTGAFGFSFSPTGTLFGINQNANLYTINLNTAATNLIGNTGLGGVESLTFDLSGNLLAAQSGAGGLHQINTTTGAAINLGTISGISDVDGLTVAPVSLSVLGFGTAPAGTFFAIDSGTLYLINPSTLVATNLGSSNGDESLAFAPDGTLFLHNFFGTLYTRNLATGVETVVMATSGSVASMAVEQGVAAVPEPSTLVLWSLGAVTFVGLGWRRRKQAA